MRKLFILSAILFFLSSCVIAQPQVGRAGGANTVLDSALFTGKAFRPPAFADTTTANTKRTLDSAGKIIYTFDVNGLWMRQNAPKKWVRLTDANSMPQSITNISIVNQVDSSISIEICTGADACDTITYTTSVTNATSIQLITDSSVSVCSVDTVSGGTVTICDTIIVGKKNTVYFFQNGVGILEGSNGIIVEHGYPLLHNTTMDVGYYKYTIPGVTVYDYPFNVSQGQGFANSTSVASFLHASAGANKFGINYTGNNYPALATGYFGNTRQGYLVGTNITGSGSFGMTIGDQNAKVAGLMFHTKDTTLTDVVTIYGARPPLAVTAWNMQPNTMDSTRIAVFHYNKDIELLGKTYLNGKRFETALGANVAAANNLTLGTDGNVFTITGNTQINAITTANWQAGSVIILGPFIGTPTVKHNTAGGAGTAPILLAGATDFTAAVNDALTLVYNGTNWIETARKISSSGGGGIYTVNNGLTASTATNFQLGGTLIQNTAINGGNFDFEMNTLNDLYFGLNGQFDIEAITDGTHYSLQTMVTSAVDANNYWQVDAKGGSDGSYLRIAPAAMITSGRFELDKGGSVAAANDLVLGTDGNLFSITGNTQINAITTANWQAGSEIGFIFTGTPTLKNNTAGGAGTATMLLAGRVDYTAAAGDYIAFVYDGTNWYETQRKLAASGGTYAFSNALTESPAGTVKWGGTLTGNTTVSMAGFTTTWSGTVAGYALTVNNSGSGGINAFSNGSNAALGGSNTGSGPAVTIQSVTGTVINALKNASSTNTYEEMATFSRNTTGTAANNIGGQINLNSETSDGLQSHTNTELKYRWVDATTATRTSQFTITGVLSASTVDMLVLNANGSMQLRPITATAASAITPAEGMLLFTSTTDATFTSIGLWCYENGAWSKK
jgi:hypothetical protein